MGVLVVPVLRMKAERVGAICVIIILQLTVGASVTAEHAMRSRSVAWAGGGRSPESLAASALSLLRGLIRSQGWDGCSGRGAGVGPSPVRTGKAIAPAPSSTGTLADLRARIQPGRLTRIALTASRMVGGGRGSASSSTHKGNTFAATVQPSVHDFCSAAGVFHCVAHNPPCPHKGRTHTLQVIRALARS